MSSLCNVDVIGPEVSDQSTWSSVLSPEVSKNALLSRPGGEAGSGADSDCPSRASPGDPLLVGLASVIVLLFLFPM